MNKSEVLPNKMMIRIFSFLTFFCFFSLIYGGMNYYVYRHIVEGFNITGYGLIVLTALFWFLGSAYIINQIIKRRIYIRLLAYIGAGWMGVLSFALSVFIAFDIAKFFISSEYYHIGFNLSVLIILIITLVSIVIAARGPVLKRVKIRHKKLEGKTLKIALLSDLHLGALTSEKWLRKVVVKVNELDADIIAITGDFVDDGFEAVKKYVPYAERLKAKEGVFAIAGNHEHYQGKDSFIRFCNEAKIRVLDNEAETLLGSINVIGLDDISLNRSKDNHEELKGIFEGINKGLYNILMLHQPIGFEKSVDLGIDLQLSGHTHGGQILPLNIIVYFYYKYSYGLYSYKDSHIYTTSGTGTWGPPMRLFTNSEIVLIEVN